MLPTHRLFEIDTPRAYMYILAIIKIITKGCAAEERYSHVNQFFHSNN